ncbi:hypothetical protein A9Q84_01865 [Halobacteriovorax marinus]|uniref:TonB C-terminal domain-containing protein n=1 Tax=Halobacteriovorax marinus TaxID=97084 RepID=A0A1Y5FCJ0_9BACT|nr:hypothetical protein A9Q84_01865 [Halobacteriovorax marinus]
MSKTSFTHLSIVLSLALHGLIYIHFQNKNEKVKSIYSQVHRTRITLKTTNRKYSKKQQKSIPTPIKKRVVKKSSKRVQKKIVKPTKKISKFSQIMERTLRKPITKSSGHRDMVAKYLSKVRQSILKNKFYPRVARRLKQQGEVVVTFAIRWPNTIEDVRLKKMTPYALLNQSALESVKSLTELAIMPEKLKTQVLKVEIPLVYRGL